MKTQEKLVGVPDWIRPLAMYGSVAACVLLVQAGCGIPATRCAISGPRMPPEFRLNNRAISDDKPEKLDYYQSDAPGRARPGNTSKSEKVEGVSAENSRGESAVASSFQPVVRPVSYDADPPDESAVSSPVVVPAERASPDPLIADVSDVPLPQDSRDNALSLGPLDASSTEIEATAPLPVDMFFADPYLLELFELAMAGNQELRVLTEEINIANNEVYARSGEYRPFVTGGSGVGLEKSSRFSRAGAVEDQLEAAPGRGFPDPLPEFLVATNVSWELDIWKKLRNAQSAAAMRFLGTRDGRNYVVTRLIAEVAASYFELLALDNRLTTLQKTIEIQEQSLKVAESMKAAGRGTELAVQRFQGEVRKNQSEKLIIQQEIVEAENRINFLVGRYPQPVERSSVEYIDLQLNTLSAGLPADLLRNRSDIRQAERKVSAAGLDLQVARARFFPSLGLRAGVGLNAFNTNYLLSTPESLIYNVALDLIGPLINKRAIKADYCTANATQLQSIYDYQKTVLLAHIEVVNFLTKVENYGTSIEFKKEQLAALEASVDAAAKLFQNARTEYIEVLLAQREMMEARMSLIETKQQQLMAIVEAYQALGGGATFAVGQ